MGSPIQPAGVLELLLRGFTIPDIVIETGVPALPIVEAFTREEDFERLTRVRRTLGEFRAIHLERLKLDAFSRLTAIGLRLKEEYPNGMTGDDVRLVETQRRACISLIRLSAFPRASESRADERSPRLPASARSDAADNTGDGGRSRSAGDSDRANGLRELEELAEIWAKVPLSPPRRRAARSKGCASPDNSVGAWSDGHALTPALSPRERGSDCDETRLSAESEGHARLMRPGEDVTGEDNHAALAAPPVAAPPAVINLSREESGGAGVIANGIAAQPQPAMGDGMLGLNRAARRRLMRLQKKSLRRARNGSSNDHPP